MYVKLNYLNLGQVAWNIQVMIMGITERGTSVLSHANFETPPGPKKEVYSTINRRQECIKSIMHTWYSIEDLLPKAVKKFLILTIFFKLTAKVVKPTSGVDFFQRNCFALSNHKPIWLFGSRLCHRGIRLRTPFTDNATDDDVTTIYLEEN